ncbi:MAG: hydrogenase maturation nickel metallochaperone HypA [Burkholderiaceae bacterium]|nr:hydrogenase maturation nickel metallochaperone HypA [Burkholderiaceae bacterium]
MHELSLAGGVLQLVESAAAREGFVRVRRLLLEAGALSGVETRALRFALEALAPGTCLEGAEIHIDEPAAPAWCHGCCAQVQVRSRLDDCPACGSARLQPTGGTELRVRELIVHDA